MTAAADANSPLTGSVRVRPAGRQLRLGAVERLAGDGAQVAGHRLEGGAHLRLNPFARGAIVGAEQPSREERATQDHGQRSSESDRRDADQSAAHAFIL